MIQTEIEKFEKDFSITLPEDYKNFLIYSKGEDFSLEQPYDFQMYYEGELMDFCISNLDSLIDVRISSESLWHFIPENAEENVVYYVDAYCFLRICWESSSANSILLGVKKEYYGKVYFLEKEPVYPGFEMRFFLLENSFAEFFNKILLNN